MSNTSKNMNMQAIPNNFLQNILLLPNFYLPENKELEQFTHNSIRNSLFLSSLQMIRSVELKHIKANNDYFQFISLKEYKESSILSYLRKFKLYYIQRKLDTQLVDSQLWTIKRVINSKEKEKTYKVLVYQDKENERFYTKVIPTKSIFDKLRMLYYHYRLD